MRFGRRLRGRLLRDAAAVIVGTEAVAGRHAAAGPRAARPHPRRAVGAAARVPTPADGADAGRRTHGAGRGRRRAARARRRATSCTPGASTPARTSPRCSRRWPRSLRAGRPPELPADVAWPPRVLLVGASPDDRASIARAAARRGVGERWRTRRVCEMDRLAAARPRVAGRRAPRRVRGDRAGRARGHRGRRAGRGHGGRRPARDRRRGRASWSSRATSSDWRPPCDAIWLRRTGPRPGRRRGARERSWPSSRTWDDVAAETRAIYAAVGDRLAVAGYGEGVGVGEGGRRRRRRGGRRVGGGVAAGLDRVRPSRVAGPG